MKIELRLVATSLPDNYEFSSSSFTFESDDHVVATYFAAVDFVRRMKVHEPDCPGAPPDRHIVGDENDNPITVPLDDPGRGPWGPADRQSAATPPHPGALLASLIASGAVKDIFEDAVSLTADLQTTVMPGETYRESVGKSEARGAYPISEAEASGHFDESEAP